METPNKEEGAVAKAACRAIFARSADRLENANAIYAGQVIVLPAK